MYYSVIRSARAIAQLGTRYVLNVLFEFLFKKDVER